MDKFYSEYKYNEEDVNTFIFKFYDGFTKKRILEYKRVLKGNITSKKLTPTARGLCVFLMSTKNIIEEIVSDEEINSDEEIHSDDEIHSDEENILEKKELELELFNLDIVQPFSSDCIANGWLFCEDNSTTEDELEPDKDALCFEGTIEDMEMRFSAIPKTRNNIYEMKEYKYLKEKDEIPNHIKNKLNDIDNEYVWDDVFLIVKKYFYKTKKYKVPSSDECLC